VSFYRARRRRRRRKRRRTTTKKKKNMKREGKNDICPGARIAGRRERKSTSKLKKRKSEDGLERESSPLLERGREGGREEG